MLTKCPECDLQISDKALVCPHCGYPLKSDRPYQVRPSSKRKRLPNGFGQITELKNQNLRNRFRASVSVGKKENGRPIVRLLTPNAYFPTYNDAYAALLEYNRNPYDLDSALTIKELFEKWMEKYETTASPGGVRAYKAAWKYCSAIYTMPVKEVRARHIKGCIDEGFIIENGEKKYPTANHKTRIKSLFNIILDFALEYELVEKNYARTFAVSEDILREAEDSVQHHIAFTDEEMDTLWENEYNVTYADYILFQCYSGVRPQELGLLLIANTFLDEGYIRGGMKSAAGKDRIIPIHSKVKHIVEEEYNYAKSIGSPFLFCYKEKENRKGTYHMTYTRYRSKFLSVIQALGLNPEHKAHDPRKTFVTKAKKYNMDEYALKRIVGHEIDDLTEAVYTDRPIEWYISEIEKIKE